MNLYPDEIKRIAHQAAHEVAKVVIQRDIATIPSKIPDVYKNNYEEIYKFIEDKLS